MLRCDHKPLEPFPSRGMKIARLERWAMLLQVYDIKFIHIKGKYNILADTISRLCTIDIYEDPAEVKLKHPPVPTIQPESSMTADECSTPGCWNHPAAVEHHHQDSEKVAKAG